MRFFRVIKKSLLQVAARAFSRVIKKRCPGFIEANENDTPISVAASIKPDQAPFFITLKNFIGMKSTPVCNAASATTGPRGARAKAPLPYLGIKVPPRVQHPRRRQNVGFAMLVGGTAHK